MNHDEWIGPTRVEKKLNKQRVEKKLNKQTDLIRNEFEQEKRENAKSMA